MYSHYILCNYPDIRVAENDCACVATNMPVCKDSTTPDYVKR